MEKLRLLLLEDLSADAELILRTLERFGMAFNAIISRNRNEFIAAIEDHIFDAVLADNSLPQFSALEAIEICKEKSISVPFILVTGSISEEFAVDIMKKGACDYILKDRMHRLPNAVLSAIHNFRLEIERKKHLDRIITNEALLKEAAAIAHFGSWEVDLMNNVHRWSDEQYKILGYAPGEVEPSWDNYLVKVHPDDRTIVNEAIENTLQDPYFGKYNFRIVNNDAYVKHISAETVVKRDENGNILRLNGFMWDITDAKEAEIKEKQISADLIQRNNDLEQFAYIISHNLRAPVANIVGVSELLAYDDLDTDSRKLFLDSIISSVKKIDDIILDLNQILQSKHHINDNKEKVVFSDLVNDIQVMMGNYLNDKSVSIICDFNEVNEMSTIKSYMHSIFYNLISNSIKFKQTGKVPVIEIKSYKNNGSIGISFKDNCIGIDLEKYGGKLFGLYKRFHQDHAEGKGMGLYMVRNHVETLGGKISVESVVNKGTEFKIEFKIA